MQQIVSLEGQGKRLDSFVAEAMPRLSRSFVQKMCQDGRAMVNEAQSKPGHKLKVGDIVNVDYDEAILDLTPFIDLPILYEDADTVVINKPAGILTHAPNAQSREPSVASFLRNRQTSNANPQSTPSPGVKPVTGGRNVNLGREGVVHRLDRATTGVLIGAKSQAALSWLQKQFAQRKVKKTYVAVVEGILRQPEAIIDMPIERNPKAPATFRIGPNGKPSMTHYKVIREGVSSSLVELRPETGRTHQLRVHLAKLGHPIIGDPLYGKAKFGDRLMLHALSLEITLPNKERMTFIAPLPKEFESALK